MLCILAWCSCKDVVLLVVSFSGVVFPHVSKMALLSACAFPSVFRGEILFEESDVSDWIGSIQDDFSLNEHVLQNHTVVVYRPWGSPGVSAAVAVTYSLFVTLANALLVAVLLSSPRLLNSRQNILILHLAIVDLAVGLFYCPLTADLYIRGLWAHGCNSFFVWFIFLYPQVFLSIHLIGLLNLVRLLGTCCYVHTGRWVKNVLFGAALMLLWFYLVMMGAVLDRSRDDNIKIALGGEHVCRALVTNDGVVLINVLIFFLPAGVCVFLLAVNVLRERTVQPIPRAQLELDSETEQNTRVPLHVLLATTMTSCLTPVPFFIITTVLSSGGCITSGCIEWVTPMSTVSEWCLFSKAGILPILWLLSPDIKMALMGAFHHFRRLPTSDTRELVEGEVREDMDDAPFSEI